MAGTHRYEELLPREMEAEMTSSPICFVPSGTLEWHSFHLPLGLDGLKAHALCEAVAERVGGVVVPTTYWAIGGVPYPWTTRVDPVVVEDLFMEIYRQLSHIGARVIVALAGHYSLEHYLALKRAGVQLMRESSLTVLPLADFEVVVDEGYRGDHAARWETSLLWDIRPDLVHLERLPDGPPDGVIGEDPRVQASREDGARMRSLIVERVSEMAHRLLRRTSPLDRSAYIDALAAQVRVMEAIAAERQVKPKSAVSPLLTNEYVEYLLCLRAGEYRTATERANAALAAVTGEV